MMVEAGSPDLALAASLVDGSVLSRQTGQRPAGASGGSGLPQLGQIGFAFIGLLNF
jgi:hypothetical protein